MADPLSVLFKQSPGRRASIGGITMDALISEDHENSAEVTDHPIETGGFVTDHVYLNPKRLTVKGEITDSPVSFFSVLNGISVRRIEAKEKLEELYKNRMPVTLVTGLAIYTDMVIQRLDFPRDQRTGQRLLFTGEFKQVKFAESEIVGVAAEKVAPENKDKVIENKDVGRAEPKEPNESQEEKATQKSSTLSKAVDAIGGLF